MATHLIEQLLMDKRANLGLPVENVKTDVEMIKDILDINYEIEVNDDAPITENFVTLVITEIHELFEARK